MSCTLEGFFGTAADDLAQADDVGMGEFDDFL